MIRRHCHGSSFVRSLCPAPNRFLESVPSVPSPALQPESQNHENTLCRGNAASPSCSRQLRGGREFHHRPVVKSDNLAIFPNGIRHFLLFPDSTHFARLFSIYFRWVRASWMSVLCPGGVVHDSCAETKVKISQIPSAWHMNASLLIVTLTTSSPVCSCGPREPHHSSNEKQNGESKNSDQPKCRPPGLVTFCSVVVSFRV